MTIIDAIGTPAALEQLAEECCELGKAALKLSRIMRGENPTPVSIEVAQSDFAEEAGDVTLVLNLLQRHGLRIANQRQQTDKMVRWISRLKKEGKL